MSTERVPENIVVCIDTSRSMVRTDYKPNRLIASVDAIKKLISERLAVDPNSFFALVQFSTKPKKLIDFTNIKEELYEVLNDLEFSGNSGIGEALGLSIKMIIVELRKIAAKTPRILLITDGKDSNLAIDPIKMARLAQGLKIKIDSLRLGELSANNLLKKLSDITGGNYYYNDSACKNFAKRN